MVYFSIYLSMARCIISCFFASHVFCVIKMESVRFFLINDEMARFTVVVYVHLRVLMRKIKSSII